MNAEKLKKLETSVRLGGKVRMRDVTSDSLTVVMRELAPSFFRAQLDERRR